MKSNIARRGATVLMACCIALSSGAWTSATTVSKGAAPDGPALVKETNPLGSARASSAILAAPASASKATSASGSFTRKSVSVGINPYGCMGKADEAHKSGGFASAHAWIKCTGNSPSELVTGAEVAKKGWFGEWYRMAWNQKTAKAKLYVDANAKRYCVGEGVQTWVGKGYHRVTIGGRVYTAATQSAETRWNC